MCARQPVFPTHAAGKKAEEKKPWDEDIRTYDPGAPDPSQIGARALKVVVMEVPQCGMMHQETPLGSKLVSRPTCFTC